MNAKELIQTLRDVIQTKAQIEETEIATSALVGDGKLCRTRVIVPVEGEARLFEVEVREIATHPSNVA